MAVFRVERNKGYTVMSNHHLRNKELSLKAKGLLSQMLSLPEDWDYTLAGLSFINREKIDAIREAVKELERAGYIVRSRERDEKGRLRGADYVIFEQPQTPPVLDLPTLENPTLDNPTLEKPTQEKPTLENPTQLNKDIQKTNLPKKEKSNIDLSSTDSIPIHSLNPLPYDGEAAEPPERKRKEATDAYSVYEEIIKDNIEYDHFVRYGQVDKDRLDEIVSIILETVCSKRKTIRIAGDDYPAELVKAKFMKLNSSHIEFVFDCMKENTTKIRNIKAAFIPETVYRVRRNPYSDRKENAYLLQAYVTQENGRAKMGAVLFTGTPQKCRELMGQLKSGELTEGQVKELYAKAQETAKTAEQDKGTFSASCLFLRLFIRALFPCPVPAAFLSAKCCLCSA